MAYRFATQKTSYAAYASGQVFYSLPGHPALPLRLSSEIFQRALAHLPPETAPYALYDPCCGSAYHLSTLAYLHWFPIKKIIVSDIDPEALKLAQANLALLSLAGLKKRIKSIEAHIEAYHKPAHHQALAHAQSLKQILNRHLSNHKIETQSFQANAGQKAQILAGLGPNKVDLVLSDLPYGEQSRWQAIEGLKAHSPAWQLLENLQDVVKPQGVVALAADKSQKLKHPAYQSLEKFKVGKRQIVLLRPI